jgi:hypothetical protein
MASQRLIDCDTCASWWRLFVTGPIDPETWKWHFSVKEAATRAVEMASWRQGDYDLDTTARCVNGIAALERLRHTYLGWSRPVGARGNGIAASKRLRLVRLKEAADELRRGNGIAALKRLRQRYASIMPLRWIGGNGIAAFKRLRRGATVNSGDGSGVEMTSQRSRDCD